MKICRLNYLKRYDKFFMFYSGSHKYFPFFCHCERGTNEAIPMSMLRLLHFVRNDWIIISCLNRNINLRTAIVSGQPHYKNQGVCCRKNGYSWPKRLVFNKKNIGHIPSLFPENIEFTGFLNWFVFLKMFGICFAV